MGSGDWSSGEVNPDMHVVALFTDQCECVHNCNGTCTVLYNTSDYIADLSISITL